MISLQRALLDKRLPPVRHHTNPSAGITYPPTRSFQNMRLPLITGVNRSWEPYFGSLRAPDRTSATLTHGQRRSLGGACTSVACAPPWCYDIWWPSQTLGLVCEYIADDVSTVTVYGDCSFAPTGKASHEGNAMYLGNPYSVGGQCDRS